MKPAQFASVLVFSICLLFLGCQPAKKVDVDVTTWIDQTLDEFQSKPWPRFSNGDLSEFCFIQAPRSLTVKVKAGHAINVRAASVAIMQKEGRISVISIHLINGSSTLKGCGDALIEATTPLHSPNDSKIGKHINDLLTCDEFPQRYHSSELVADRVRVEVSVRQWLDKTWWCSMEFRKVAENAD